MRIPKICSGCGSTFFTQDKGQTLCSSCQKAGNWELPDKVCAVCGKHFFGQTNQKCCSAECSQEHSRKMRTEQARRHRERIKMGIAQQVPLTRKCESCGKEFKPKTVNQKYCSTGCRPEWAGKKLLTIACAICGKKFQTTDKRRKNCSPKCSIIARREQIKKINQRNAPPKQMKTCEVCGKPFWTARDDVYTCSPECSEKRKKMKASEYQKRYQQKNGRTGSLFLKTCVICGKEFKSKSWSRAYCSEECRKERDKRREQKRWAEEKKNRPAVRINICQHCGKEFETKYRWTKYCSPECNIAAGRERSALRYQKRKNSDSGFDQDFIRRMYRKSKNMQDIEQIMRHCKAAGYGNSYGQFVADGRAETALIEDPEDKLEFMELEE